MKFKNETKEDILVRRGSSFKPDWISIKPGKEIDIDETIGIRKGLTKVKSKNKPEEEATPTEAPKEKTEAPKQKNKGKPSLFGRR